MRVASAFLTLLLVISAVVMLSPPTAGPVAPVESAAAPRALAACERRASSLAARLDEQARVHETTIREVAEADRACERRVESARAEAMRANPATRPKPVLPKSKLEKRLSSVTEALKVSAQADLERRYGSQPARVLMETSVGSLEFEMAPAHLMPYVTKWFLDLVEEGYWNGCGFVRAASHVLQANCGPKRGETRHPSIAFQEYSEEYTHKPLTLGVAGFPGGPDWYINLVDNVRNHGPGGQDPIEANPCFARVVSGQDTVKAIRAQPHESSGFEGLYKPVIIHKAVARRQGGV